MDRQQKPYVPISCSFYDYLEEAATTQHPAIIEYWQGNTLKTVTAKVKTINTNNKAEYLVLASNINIRLDFLHTFNGISLPANC